jgi:hypothetical protein
VTAAEPHGCFVQLFILVQTVGGWHVVLPLICLQRLTFASSHMPSKGEFNKPSSCNLLLLKSGTERLRRQMAIWVRNISLNICDCRLQPLRLVAEHQDDRLQAP